MRAARALGDAFGIEEFLCRQGTLYLIADQRSDASPVAPLFACLVGEIHFTACQLAATAGGGSTRRCC